MDLGTDLPLRLASRALTRVFMDPGGAPSDSTLRKAVAGSVVLVTGASHGIGEATALRLGAAGAEVIVVARSEERLDEVASRIREAGGEAHPYPCDLTDVRAVEHLAETVLDEHGPIDVVVSNAGKSIRRSVELSYDRFRDFERTTAINYLGPVRLLLALLPSMRERGEGHIVNVSTLGVRMPPAPRWSAYQASKTAFDVWLRSTAPELRTDGVGYTSIYLALVNTRMSSPTPVFRYMPGMSPDEAAGLVARAIVERPRQIEPWWVTLGSPAFEVARGPWEALNAIYYRFSADSTASAGAAQPPTADDLDAELDDLIGPVPGELGSAPAPDPDE